MMETNSSDVLFVLRPLQERDFEFLKYLEVFQLPIHRNDLKQDLRRVKRHTSGVQNIFWLKS